MYNSGRDIAFLLYYDENDSYRVQFSDGSQTEYVYSALGEKLKTIHRTALPDYKELDGDEGELSDNPLSTDVSRSLLKHAPADIPVAVDTFKQGDISMLTSLAIDSTEYIGSFIFENGHADKYLFPGGFYSYAAGHPSRTGGDGSGYYYYLTDHLGNNRVVVNDNGDIEQITHYYPFGAVYADAGKNLDFQKFKYTGKELDLTHGLNTYDHGARQNYSILGVWDRVDPLAEKYYNVSSYVICGNNPINSVDFRGDSITIHHHFGFLGLRSEDVLYEDGQLYTLDGESYTGKVKGFLKRTFDALNVISGSTDEGSDLIMSLQSSDKTFNIRSTYMGNNKFDATSTSRASIFIANPNQQYNPEYQQKAGSGGIIRWCATDYQGGSDENNSNIREPFIGLVHELAHADNANRGYSDYSLYPVQIDPKNPIHNDEKHAMEIENLIRSNMGYPLRIGYTNINGNIIFPAW